MVRFARTVRIGSSPYSRVGPSRSFGVADGDCPERLAICLVGEQSAGAARAAVGCVVRSAADAVAACARFAHAAHGASAAWRSSRSFQSSPLKVVTCAEPDIREDFAICSVPFCNRTVGRRGSDPLYAPARARRATRRASRRGSGVRIPPTEASTTAQATSRSMRQPGCTATGRAWSFAASTRPAARRSPVGCARRPRRLAILRRRAAVCA
jgi:hypothetical protein